MSLLRLARSPAPWIAADSSAQKAAAALAKQKVAALVVMDDARMVGLLTERDLVRGVVGAGLDPKTTKVADVMERKVETVRSDATPDQAFAAMAAKHLRHIVVVDRRERPMGLISFRQVAQARLASAAEELSTLEQFVTADAPGG
jgi:CBS domain-containing protein